MRRKSRNKKFKNIYTKRPPTHNDIVISDPRLRVTRKLKYKPSSPEEFEDLPTVSKNVNYYSTYTTIYSAPHVKNTLLKMVGKPWDLVKRKILGTYTKPHHIQILRDSFCDFRNKNIFVRLGPYYFHVDDNGILRKEVYHTFRSISSLEQVLDETLFKHNGIFHSNSRLQVHREGCNWANSYGAFIKLSLRSFTTKPGEDAIFTIDGNAPNSEQLQRIYGSKVYCYSYKLITEFSPEYESITSQRRYNMYRHFTRFCPYVKKYITSYKPEFYLAKSNLPLSFFS